MKTRNQTYQILLLYYVLFLTLYVAAKDRPNIIHFLTDDQGSGEGPDNPLLHMPNLQYLANTGRTMYGAHTNSVCAPSRWEMLTGSNEVTGNYDAGIEPIPDITLPKSLAELGYNTGIIGKYGFGKCDTIGSSLQMGFNYSLIYPTHIDAHQACATWLEENCEIIKFRENRSRNKCTYMVDVFIEAARRFIMNNIKNDFYLVYATPNPHVQYKHFKSKLLSTWVPNYDQYKSKKWAWAPSPYDKVSWSTSLRGHAAMFNYIDRDLGIIMNTLREYGLANDTIIIYTSDNGPEVIPKNVIPSFNAAGELRGNKRNLYEGGTRVTAYINWPGHIPANSTSYYHWKTQYLLPTITEIAGVKVSKPRTVSMLPVWLHGDSAAEELGVKTMTIQYCDRNKEKGRTEMPLICMDAVYDLQKWPNETLKLVTVDNIPRELYELGSDPSEHYDVINEPKYAIQLSSLRRESNRLRM